MKIKLKLKRENDLLSLAIQLREFKLGCSGRISDGNIELKIKFILEKIIDIPTFTGPTSTFRIRGRDTKPIVVVGFVHLSVSNKRLVLFLQPGRPCRSVSGTCLCC